MAQKSKKRSHMERRAVRNDAIEQDALTGWRHMLCYLTKPGAAAYAKTRANRAERYRAKREIHSGSWV